MYALNIFMNNYFFAFINALLKVNTGFSSAISNFLEEAKL